MTRFVQIAAALLLTAAPASAAVQIIEDGKLVGATGVDVGGTLYDVSFLDGSCASLFNGCDDTADFTFRTTPDAVAAGNALLQQVFTGQFDSSPALTFGCGDESRCDTYIPYGSPIDSQQLRAETAVVVNWSLASEAVTAGDIAGPSRVIFNRDTTAINREVFALFRLSSATVAAVPEPSTWGMMLMGFGAMGFALRRRKRVASLTQMA